MRVVLGVAGGIAAYKAVSLLRLLTGSGHDVVVVPTEAALQMVGRATWQALSHNPVHTTVFDDPTSAEHVLLGQSADLVVVAPATANLLARARAGIADDLLTTTLLVATCPVVMAPAMHTEMWNHAATRENVAELRQRGVTIIEPVAGELAGGDSGMGRLPEPEEIFTALQPHLAERPAAWDGALTGVRVLVSAGGTREAIDPARYIGNNSSGRQGIAVARAALHAGADVTLVAANVAESLLSGLSGIHVERVTSSAQLEEAVGRHRAVADVVVMAAAVADFRPVATSEHKLKKEAGRGIVLELEQTADILAGLVGQRRPGQVIIGFAAETGDGQHTALEHAQEKARRKGADLLVFNEVSESQGFGDRPNAVVFLDNAGREVSRAAGSKDVVGGAVVKEMMRLLGKGPVEG